MNARRIFFRLGMRLNQHLSAMRFLRRSTGKAGIVFFPGCSLAGYNPDYVFSVRDYITGNIGECGILTACCAKPLKLMGDTEIFRMRVDRVNRELDTMTAETVITACQNCYSILKFHSEGRNILSLWPVILKHGLPERLRGKYSGLEFAVQDSCSSTPEIASSVRGILGYLGVSVREFPGSRLKCCGGSQAIVSRDPSFGRECMRKRADESPCCNIVSYCASCRSAMSIYDTHTSIHILDMIFGDGNPSPGKSPIINRIITARRLKKV